MTAAMIEATGINAWYGSSHILRDVEFRVGTGETVGLLGRNGMGKSTLLRTLLGHVRQRSGTIRVAGRDVSRAQAFEVARLGVAYVPEGRGVFPNLSVRENLVMAARKGCNGRQDWDERACSTCSRDSRSAWATAGSNCPAASSRCCRSAAR